jgi:IclR family transcriptional regulator, KDG regulon repressor
MARIKKEQKPKAASRRKMIGSVQKAADILKVFLNDESPHGITDFSRKLSLPKPTVQNLVQTLEDIGFLDREPRTGKYTLGSEIFQLGMRYAASMDLISIARVWMENLCLQFNQAVQAGMIIGGGVVVIFRMDPASRFMAFPQAGSVIPFHCSAIGKVLLAYADPEARAAVMEGKELVRFTPHTITGMKDFLAELERVKSAGTGFDNEESVLGLSCISAPVFNARGQVMAAFSVSGKTGEIRADRERIIGAVRYAGAQISSQLGFRMNTFPS